MGGVFALIGGFVGFVGLGVMYAHRWTYGADPIGIVLFSALAVNGIIALVRRMRGAEESVKVKGPFSRPKRRR